MKAISIPQPWAWLVVRGYKEMEKRSWKPEHRGPLLIHAGSRMVSREEYARFVVYCRSTGIARFPSIDEFDCGGIVGKIDVIDCLEAGISHESGRREYAVVSANPCVSTFEPMKGRRKIWYVDELDVPGLTAQFEMLKRVELNHFPVLAEDRLVASILAA
jgi:hypothetical protein